MGASVGTWVTGAGGVEQSGAGAVRKWSSNWSQLVAGVGAASNWSR